MVSSTERLTTRQRSWLAETREFKRPSPGDVFILAAFGWAAICFLLVIGGQRFAMQAARLSASASVRELFLIEQTAIASLMIVGIMGIGVAFFLISRYRQLAMGMLLFSLTFASSIWSPVHSVSFAAKYIILIYLACFAAIFVFKNLWKILGTPGYRLLALYLGWMAFIALLNGLRIADIWYTFTEVSTLIGLGVGWLTYVRTREDLERFNRLLGYTAIVVTLFHLLSPFVGVRFIDGGRFVSMFGKSTGFSVIYSVSVVCLFWLSMYEKDVIMSRVYTAFASVGYVLLLWSGSRNGIFAALVGLASLWWVFRTRIIVYVLLAAIVGLLMQIILGGSESFEFLVRRIASTENTRLEVWKLYLGLVGNSPIVGYGPGGLAGAIYGEQIAGLISSVSRPYVPGTHNAYLGFAARFGLVGLVLYVSIFVISFRRAWRVIFNRNISPKDKELYILPATLLGLVALEGLFEDTMGSTGRGTVHNFIMGMAVPLVFVYGGALLERATPEKSRAGDRHRRNVGGVVR